MTKQDAIHECEHPGLKSALAGSARPMPEGLRRRVEARFAPPMRSMPRWLKVAASVAAIASLSAAAAWIAGETGFFGGREDDSEPNFRETTVQPDDGEGDDMTAGKKMGAALLVAATSAAPMQLAAELPFYKEGSTTPNRTPASESVSANAVAVDSRTVQSASSVPGIFNSDGVPGVAIIVR